MKSEELIKKLRDETKGKPREEWSDEAKSIYIELIKNDYALCGKIFFKLFETDPVRRPTGDTYVLTLDEEERSMLLTVLQTFRRVNCTKYAKSVGYTFSATDYHVNKKEFVKQFEELKEKLDEQ